MRTILLLILIASFSRVAKADSPVIWFGLWAKSLTSNGLEARGLKLDKDATGTPAVTVIPSSSLATSWQMTLPVDDGAANDVLISDGAGVTSWANPTSLITGTANTFAGYTSLGALSSVPGWNWINATGGANVQLAPVPTTGEGFVNLHTFGSSLNPTSNVTGSSWIQNQSEINVGSDDSGFSFSADGSGQLYGLQLNVNARNKSSVGQVVGLAQNTQIGNGVDAVSSNSYSGISTNFQVSDNATAQNQSYAFQNNASVGTGGSMATFATLQGNINSTGTITNLFGSNLGGNANDVTGNFNGYVSNFNFNDVNDYQGFSSNSNITGTVTSSFKGFSAAGNVGTTNGASIFADFMNITTNATNGYTSFNATPTITTTNSYLGLNLNPNMGTVGNSVQIIDTAGTASVSTPYWTDLNIHPNLTLVTDGYKGINVTPVAAGDGSGYGIAAYFDASQLTNFSAGQVLALQTNGNAQIDGKLNAFTGITPVDLGGNPNAVHSLVSGVTTPANTTTANIDTIGVNTASLMTISTNSINTSGAFGLGLSALALPAVLKTETGSSIDHVNAAVFATSLDPTSSGGTVDELVGGRFVVIPQGGTTTINSLKLVKADLPFGDPATKSWGFYGSSTTSENWFAKNIKIGGTAGTTDFVADSGSVLEVEGGSINVLNGQVKTSTTNSNIYLTPNGSGCISAQVPDSTATGGDPRGTYCVDLQTFRNNADEVASANVAVVIGAANKASAEFSMALGGTTNYATADRAVTLGGTDNTASHVGSYVFGQSGASGAVGDFIFAGGSGSSAEKNNHFRVAGDTHSVHVGVYDDTGADSFDNALLLHGRTAGTQSKYIGLKAPNSVTTSTTFTLPNGDGTSGQVLSTNGSAALSWASAATVPGTAGGVYSDGSVLQSVAFSGNANKVFGVNNAATSQEAKTLTTGTTGTDFGIAHTAGTVTFNLPDAGTSARGAVTTGSQSFAGTKTFTSGALISDGSVTGPSLGLASDQDGTGTGLYRVGANSLGFSANGVNVGQYSSVGAWTFAPSGFSGAHTANGNELNIKDSSTVNGNSTLKLKALNGSSVEQTGSITMDAASNANQGLYFTAGAGKLWFYNSSVNSGQVSTSGAWTVGDTANAAFPGNNLVGRKDGSSVGSGYIGEILRVSPVSATHLSTQIANGGISIGSGATTTNYILYKSSAVGDAVKLSLTPGVWDVDAGCEFTDSANPSTITLLQFYVGTVTTASSIGSNGDNRWVTRALKETGTSGTLVTPRVSTTITTATNQDVYLYTLFQGTVTGSWSFDGCWFVGKRIA